MTSGSKENASQKRPGVGETHMGVNFKCKFDKIKLDLGKSKSSCHSLLSPAFDFVDFISGILEKMKKTNFLWP